MNVFKPRVDRANLSLVHRPSLKLISTHVNRSRNETALITGQRQACKAPSSFWLKPVEAKNEQLIY